MTSEAIIIYPQNIDEIYLTVIQKMEIDENLIPD